MVIALLGLLLSGCSQPATTTSNGQVSSASLPAPGVSISNTEMPSATVTRRTQPLTTRWPPALAAAILWHRDGFSVVDRQGIVFSERRALPPMPKTTATTTSSGHEQLKLKPGISGHAMSANRRLLAYSFPGEDLVVRSILTGEIEQRMSVKVDAANDVLAVSDDGRYVALGLSSLQAFHDTQHPSPWTITIIDLVRQTQTVPAPLAELVTRPPKEAGSDPYSLIGIWWLPDDRLLVGVSGPGYETYLYDPAKDSLSRFPLDYIQPDGDSVSSSGKVVGIKYGPKPKPGPRSNGTFPEWRWELMVWDGGITEPVVFDEAWPRGGPGASVQMAVS